MSAFLPKADVGPPILYRGAGKALLSQSSCCTEANVRFRPKVDIDLTLRCRRRQ